MAYAANGYEYVNKKLSRVKYNMPMGNGAVMPKAPELVKIGITVAPDVFFDSATDYTPVPFDSTLVDYNYGDQIFTDVAAQKNMVWVGSALTGTCLFNVLDFINFTLIDDYMTHSTTINLVADTDYPIANPFPGLVIPKFVEVLASDGTHIIGLYINMDQSSGVVTINSGSNYSNAIVNIIGW